MMTPGNPGDFAKYYALKATADSIALVGIDNVTAQVTDILVEVNLSSPTFYGLPLFPVVDFATTPQYASEQLELFDAIDDDVLTLGDLATLNDALLPADRFAALAGCGLWTIRRRSTTETLLEILNTDDTGDSLGVIDIVEAAALLGRRCSGRLAGRGRRRRRRRQDRPPRLRGQDRWAARLPEHGFADHPRSGIRRAEHPRHRHPHREVSPSSSVERRK